MATGTDRFRDDDDILRELEEEDDEEAYKLRERRVRELQREMSHLNEMKQNRHGLYENVTSEKEILRLTTTIRNCIVHFYHKDFRRCQIADQHLDSLARKHFKAKFAKIDVENAPFLVEKLQIQVLPCICSFVDGICIDKIIGFERLGGTDSFTTQALEKLLDNAGVLKISEETEKKTTRKTIFGFKEEDSDESDD